MAEGYTTERLLMLRKLTRATSDLLRSQMKDYLSTLAPLLRPKMVLGNYVEGESYDPGRVGEKSFAELRQLYTTIAKSRLYNLPPEFKTPLEVINSQLEMIPCEYEHTVGTGDESKPVVVTSPLKWMLGYAGFSQGRLRALLKDTNRKGDDLQQCVLHHLMMHSAVTKQTGVNQILEALHFPLSVGHAPEFGELPLCFVSSSISTIRLPDAVIIESTEISGMDAVEEVVNVADLARLTDPLKDRLIPLFETYGALSDKA